MHVDTGLLRTLPFDADAVSEILTKVSYSPRFQQNRALWSMMLTHIEDRLREHDCQRQVSGSTQDATG
jgi:hypothetical protein